jgi:hypothetical protein
MWDVGHPLYGKPREVAGNYLGFLQGTHRWHGFEVWFDGQEIGVIFMNDKDLEQLHVEDI